MNFMIRNLNKNSKLAAILIFLFAYHTLYTVTLKKKVIDYHSGFIEISVVYFLIAIKIISR